MPSPGPMSNVAGALRHTYHPLRIDRVVPETADTSSFVLDIPTDLQQAFGYQAGQFCTFRVPVDDQSHVRCYSMSSSPAVDAELIVTVKRVADGVVSNWMIDSLAPGDLIDVAPPAGFFQLSAGDGDLVAFSGGSGITPVYSLIKTALATTSRRVHLLYANRDADAVIFASELDRLVQKHGDRLRVVHHLDDDHGFVGAGDIRSFVGPEASPDNDFYICGPGPFMDIVEQTLLTDGVDAGHLYIERFTPAEGAPLAEPRDGATTSTRVTVELDGRTGTVDHHPGTTILQTARQMGMAPPFSCEAGSCATCMARLVEGAVKMHVNNALTADEVEAGWVLTCQSVPTTPVVHVVYGYD